MSISWTKTWSASDDGSILTGAQLGTFQDDINNSTVHLTGNQTINGEKTFNDTVTFSGATTFSSTVTGLVKTDEFVCYEESICCYEGELVYLQ